MKISFNGLKGFTEKDTSVSLTDLTILTGKNSSGKSSFNKLLQLIFNSFKDINRIEDILKVEIDIGNEVLGGKDSIMTFFNDEDIYIKFDVEFEFYRDLFELKLNIDLSEYALKINTIELIHIDSVKNKKNILCTWGKEYLTIDSILLRSLYLKNVRIFNCCEIFDIEKSEFIDKDWQKQIDKFTKYASVYNDVKIEQFISNHSKGNVVWEIVEGFAQDFEFKPFYMYEWDWTGEYYLLSDDLFQFKISKKDLISKLPNDDINYKGLLNDLFAKGYSENDLIQLLIEIYNFDIFNFVLLHNNNDKLSFYSAFRRNRVFENNILFNLIHEIDSIYFGELLHDLFSDYINYINLLVRKSSDIFNFNILKIFKNFSEIDQFSNLRNTPTRNFNIYSEKSIFSSFIKNWKINDVANRNNAILFLKKYIKEFDIADNILIELKDNIGFISLVKKNKAITVIDEGSGISNVLALLLFFSNIIFTNKSRSNEDYFINILNKFVILEEPESNLHPQLQSKLADLIINVINEFNIAIIVETHSEYMIRKIQYLVTKNMFKSEKVSINYFSLFFKGKKQLVNNNHISLNNKGQLSSEFGSGFFDESNNLAIELFVTNNKNN